MKRRNFLKYTAPLAATPMMLQGRSMSPFMTKRMMEAFTNCAEVADRAIVLIQMKGGNDGLNTIVPLDQMSDYAFIRPTTKLAESALINLDTTLAVEDQVGLHPAMTGLKDLYDAGKLNIIQGVNYANNNKSHFKGTDLWLTGGDTTAANFGLTTGWMGRYLDNGFPGYAGNTNLSPDPLGIQLGDRKPSFGFVPPVSSSVSMNLSGQDPAGYYSLVQGIGGAPLNSYPNTEHGAEMQYIMNVQANADLYAQRITQVFNQGSNTTSVSYPDSDLADQLKTIARLISGGSTTKVFLANISGFDTHDNQVESGDTSIGWHAGLMTDLSNSIKAFQDDLQGLNVSQKVMTVTFSEFGRKAVENGNFGTDHGTLAPMFVIGDGVTPGITGTNVNLADLGSNGTQLQYQQHDYRQVYTSILQDWLGASDDVLTDTNFPLSLYPKIDIVGSNFAADPSCYGAAALPIELVFFQARAIDNKEVMLTWDTAVEYNSSHFIVERSGDGETFEPIFKVDTDGENKDELTRYQEWDLTPLEGTSYYRLKLVDKDDTFEYSDIRNVFIAGQSVGTIKLYPNPAIYDVNLTLLSESEYSAKLSIVNMNGMIHEVKSINVREGFNKYSFDVSSYPKGRYHILLESKSRGVKEVKPFVIQ